MPNANAAPNLAASSAAAGSPPESHRTRGYPRLPVRPRPFHRRNGRHAPAPFRRGRQPRLAGGALLDQRDLAQQKCNWKFAVICKRQFGAVLARHCGRMVAVGHGSNFYVYAYAQS